MELEGIEPSSAEGLQPALRPFPCLRLYSCLIAGSNRTGKPVLTAGSFSDVSGLSRRQWSFPTVLHRFCCRAAVNRPRVALLLAMTLYRLIRSDGESEIVLIGVSVFARFKESELLRSHEETSGSNVENRSAP